MQLDQQLIFAGIAFKTVFYAPIYKPISAHVNTDSIHFTPTLGAPAHAYDGCNLETKISNSEADF